MDPGCKYTIIEQAKQCIKIADPSILADPTVHTGPRAEFHRIGRGGTTAQKRENGIRYIKSNV
jgi:hypothetical protein